jgi:molybdopterin/thiamine biosynthesis adenylyltransferase
VFRNKYFVRRDYSLKAVDFFLVKKCLRAMEFQGLLRICNGERDNLRFKKQIDFLDEFTSSYEETLSLQERIRNSRISIFGVGGIGSWVVNGLYQIGVGEIIICDPDKIELSNLNRQLFFSEKDIGRYKVDVIKENLPDVSIKTYKKFVSHSENLEEILKDSNFIVNCADTPSVQETSEVIDSYATRFDIPYMVSGGYNLHLGMIGPIIVPGKTLTFQNFLEHQKKQDKLSNLEKIKDIESTGNLGPIAGAVANIQVMEIFKYLTGKGKVNLNRFGEIDFMNLSLTWNQFGPEVNL